MRVQCDVCEKAEAVVVCCADEAALCAACDAKVHAANKLAGKHQRLPLIRPSPTEPPRCDICQEKTGWFFCVEDRALLCRSCDVSVHSANALAPGHKRFLVTGVRVALNTLSAQDFLEVPKAPEAPSNYFTNLGASSSGITQSSTASEQFQSNCTPERFEQGFSMSTTTSEPENDMEKKNSSTISEYLTEAVPGWRIDELLNIPDLAGGYTLGDVASSKADAANLGEFDWLADLSLFDEHMYVETFHEVPQMTSSSSMTSLSRAAKPLATKGKAKQGMAVVPEVDDSPLVPDLGFPQAKRRRTYMGI